MSFSHSTTPNSMDSSPSDSSDPSSISSPEKTEAFREFTEKLESLPTPEEKLAHGLAFMRNALAQEGAPRFREFWEARRTILPFFKENLNPIARSKLWSEYVEMTVEARRLKEILEEQSAFAMEQIDLAIRSLEGDLGNFEELLAQIGEIAFEGRALQEKTDLYNQIQRELNLLNALASRLTALRKEIVKTDMRIRFKTKLLKQLSELGDRIFPKRKELIESISSEFEKDVDCFVEAHFRDGQVVGAPYYALREEIKALQSMAKVFSLNSSAFTRTRLKLSKCWDQIRELEKEHRKTVSERRQASSEQRKALQDKMEELKSRCAEMPLHELDKEIEAFSREMRATPLQREDVQALREELAKLRAPLIAEKEQKARQLEEAEREKFRFKREKIAHIREQIATLLKEEKQTELESFVAEFEKLKQEIETLEISKSEKQQLERLLRPLKDLALDKKEQALLNLSEDDKKTLENLYLVLEQKKERRREIKEQMETYRKSLGTSGLDFEKAMLYRELMDQEKERLESADRGIEEIEQKIAELEG